MRTQSANVVKASLIGPNYVTLHWDVKIEPGDTQGRKTPWCSSDIRCHRSNTGHFRPRATMKHLECYGRTSL
jgi:hypothetical protein